MQQHSQFESRKRRRYPSRRELRCPLHGCYLDSCNIRYDLMVNKKGKLEVVDPRKRGKPKRKVTLKGIIVDDQWLEMCFCPECQKSNLYHVIHLKGCFYEVQFTPFRLWKSVMGGIDPRGNPSVSEFSLRNSRGSRVI